MNIVVYSACVRACVVMVGRESIQRSACRPPAQLVVYLLTHLFTMTLKSFNIIIFYGTFQKGKGGE